MPLPFHSEAYINCAHSIHIPDIWVDILSAVPKLYTGIASVINTFKARVA